MVNKDSHQEERNSESCTHKTAAEKPRLRLPWRPDPGLQGWAWRQDGRRLERTFFAARGLTVRLYFPKMPVRISLKLAISASRSEVSGLPWWLSGKESACQRRRHKFDPWSGKIPQAVDQLSLCATTVEPVLYSPGTTTTEAPRTGARAPREKPLQWEICGPQLEGRPPLVTTRENPE